MKNYYDVNCPTCRKHNETISIAYGMPTRELEECIEAGIFHMGGCVVSDDSPWLFCKRCKVEYSPKRLNKNACSNLHK